MRPAFGSSEKYWQNLWRLNFRSPDYRSVQSKEVELFFILELNLRLLTQHYHYSRGWQHSQSNPALHGHLSMELKHGFCPSGWHTLRQSEGHNSPGTAPSYCERMEGDFAYSNCRRQPEWSPALKSCFQWSLPSPPQWWHMCRLQ